MFGVVEELGLAQNKPSMKASPWRDKLGTADEVCGWPASDIFSPTRCAEMW